MLARSVVLRWGVTLGFLGLLLYIFRGILAPFVVGTALAYALNPLVHHLTKIKIPRALGALSIVALCILLIITLVFTLAPLIKIELVNFIRHVPDYTNKMIALSKPYMDTLAQYLSPDDLSKISNILNDYIGGILQWLIKFFGNLLTNGFALANIVSLTLITPLVSFYLLKDWNTLVKKIEELIPRFSRHTIKELLTQMDAAFASFVRGQSLVCLLMALFYSTGLSFVGLPFALIIGIGTGILTFIPYVGVFIGAVTSLLVALSHFGDWSALLKVLLVFGTGQIIEGYFLTPRFVGDKIGLHPVWIIFAILAGGELGGFLGVLLALPLSSALTVLIRFGITKYKSSHFYHEG